MLLAGLFFVIPAFSKHRVLAVSLFMVISLTSITLYLTSGRYAQWRQHQLVQENLTATRAEIQRLGQPKTLILQLEEKVRAAPQDAKAWYFLGKLYLGTGDLSKAYTVLERAGQLNPSPDIQLAFIQTLNLLALKADKEKNLALAIQYWKRILKELPAEAVEERKIVQKKILQTQKQG